MFDMAIKTINYINTHSADYITAVKVHLLIFVMVLGISILVGTPLGIISSKKPIFSTWVINIFSGLKMIPSLALLLVFIPIIGTGVIPATIALFLHALPTIIINTYTGFTQINVSVLESATAMGMTEGEILRKVEIPLAMPLVFTGIRTCSVDIIATTTVAAYVGAGGLGQYVVFGLNSMDIHIMLAGSLSVAILSLIIDFLFSVMQKGLTRYQKA
jgi:osmoprotectant transport system permease protein